MVPSSRVVSVAARSSLSTASSFASKHSLPSSPPIKPYGSYSELAEDADVTAVYVGSVHVFRRSHAETFLKAGKHLLLEKPLALSADDARHIYDLAESRGLMVTEGMWTYYFPAVEYARSLVAGGGLGRATSVTSDFHFDAKGQEDPETR